MILKILDQQASSVQKNLQAYESESVSEKPESPAYNPYKKSSSELSSYPIKTTQAVNNAYPSETPKIEEPIYEVKPASNTNEGKENFYNLSKLFREN